VTAVRLGKRKTGLVIETCQSTREWQKKNRERGGRGTVIRQVVRGGLKDCESEDKAVQFKL
jgi:hypothetical protein